MSKMIPLTKGYFVEVDDEDFDWLSQWRWRIEGEESKRLYAVRFDWKNQKAVRMHRLIINAPKDMQVDHIDGNTLNNKRSNLRLCTASQNSKNKKLFKSSKTGYKGVFQDKHGLYVASIGVDGKRYKLGSYKTSVEAAHAYDDAAKKYHGEYARLNFVE